MSLGPVETPFCRVSEGKSIDFGDNGEFCEKGSGLPPRGGGAEVSSLLYQAGRRKDVGACADQDQLADCIVSLYCESVFSSGNPAPRGPLSLGDFDDMYVEDIRIQILNSPDASPGLPYHEWAATKKEFCTDTLMWNCVVGLARQRLTLMCSLNPVDVASMSIVEKNALQDTVRLFVKNEIHPAEKLEKERYRLIASVSIVDQIVEIFLYGKLNKWGMSSWRVSPFKPGMGAADADHSVISAEMRAMNEPVSIDSSAHDFNVPGQIQLAYPAFCFLFDRNEFLFRLRVILELLRGDPLFCTGALRPGAYGGAWALTRFGITLSGRSETSRINTFEQCVMMKLALWPKLGNRVFAAGDDGVLDKAGVETSHIEEKFKSFGVLLKGVVPASESFADGGGIDFCSHRYDPSSEGFRRMNIGKSLANILSQDPEKQDWDQFFYEARHCAELDRLVVFAFGRGVRLGEKVRQIVLAQLRAKGRQTGVPPPVSKRPAGLIAPGGRVYFDRTDYYRKRFLGILPWFFVWMVLIAGMAFLVSAGQVGASKVQIKSQQDLNGMAKQRKPKSKPVGGLKGAKTVVVVGTGPKKSQARTSFGSKTARNNYLAAIADPWGQSPVSIPDGVGTRSQSSVTKHRVPITFPSSGPSFAGGVVTYAACIRPTVQGGLFFPGWALAPSRAGGAVTVPAMHCYNGTGSDFANYVSPLLGGAGATISAAKVNDCIGIKDFSFFAANASAIRPTAMGVKATYIGNALTATGRLIVNTHDAYEQFCPFDPPVAVPTVGAVSAVFNGVAAYADANDILDGDYSMEQPATVEAEVIWVPEFPESTLWRESPWGQGNSGNYQNLNVQISRGSVGAVVNSAPPIVPGPSNQWFGPNTHPVNPASNNLEIDGNWQMLPYISLVWEGVQPGNMVELEITIHWEYEVVSNISGSVGARPPVSNPIELAHAGNVARLMPRIAYPSIPNEPGTKGRALVLQEAGSLYNRPMKQSIEGTGFLSGLKSFASKGLGALGRQLKFLPGVGGILGQGASFLSQILA